MNRIYLRMGVPFRNRNIWQLALLDAVPLALSELSFADKEGETFWWLFMTQNNPLTTSWNSSCELRSLLNLSNGSPLNRLLDHHRTQLTRLLFYWIKAKSAATARQKLNWRSKILHVMKPRFVCFRRKKRKQRCMENSNRRGKVLNSPP